MEAEKRDTELEAALRRDHASQEIGILERMLARRELRRDHAALAREVAGVLCGGRDGR